MPPSREGCSYSSLHRFSPVGTSSLPTHAVDLAVVGAGLAGCSAALHAVRAGLDVCVLEASKVASGQSGVSGGQFIPGFENDASALVGRLGPVEARRLMAFSLGALERLREALDEAASAGPAAHLRNGGLVLGLSEEDSGYLQDELLAFRMLGLRPEMLKGSALRKHIASPLYPAALFMPSTWHGNPVRVTQTLAQEARRHGAQIQEQTPVSRLRPDGNGWVLHTPGGVVRAKRVFLAGGDSVLLRYRWFAPTVLVRTWMVATAPLSRAQIRSVLPTDACAYDVQNPTMDYFRVEDDRLVFGGGDSVARADARGVDFLRRRIFQAFPQLEGVCIENFWYGDADVSAARLPVLRNEGSLWLACGYSGHGTVNSFGAGWWAVQQMLGDSPAWRALSKLPATRFPAHRTLRRMSGALGAQVLKVFA